MGRQRRMRVAAAPEAAQVPKSHLVAAAWADDADGSPRSPVCAMVMAQIGPCSAKPIALVPPELGAMLAPPPATWS
jgi:hypothetical protein